MQSSVRTTEMLHVMLHVMMALAYDGLRAHVVTTHYVTSGRRQQIKSDLLMKMYQFESLRVDNDDQLNNEYRVQ